MAKALKIAKQEVVQLRNNRLNEDGAVAILENITDNIRELDLSDNNILLPAKTEPENLVAATI